ncbi:ABC-type multidrug transport system [Candidatus Terasakiella magnetica]|nr:ABC-type multidrug transport system [Candidatus Terasakiella magnetica]
MGGNLWRALGLLDRRARRQIVLLGAMTLVAALFEAAGIGLVFPFIKLISEPGWIADFAAYRGLSDRFGPFAPETVVFAVGLALIGLFVAKNAFMMSFYLAQYTIAFGNVSRYAEKLLAHYMRAPYAMHLRRNSAELMRNVRELPQSLFNAVVALISVTTEALVVACIGGVLLAVEPVATAWAAVLLGGMTVLFFALAGRLLRHWGAERLDCTATAQRALQESLGAIKDSRVLGREGFFVARYGRESRSLADLGRKIQTVSQVPRLSLEAVMMIGMIVVVLVMQRRGEGVDMLPRLALFAAAAFRLMPSVNRITQALTELRTSIAPLDALFADMPKASVEAGAFVSQPRLRLERDLVLEGVSFTYPGSEAPAVTGVDLTLARGDTIGLVGPSGAGKSTLVDILLGLLPPTEGRILLDGNPVPGGGWHGTVGYVPQSIYITDDTVRRNVAFGIADDEIDDKALYRALAHARLDDFIATLPDGLDTRLDEDGVRLSGGQRQRIGIARALYHDPDVLMLDEATSALDPITERDITAAIRALHGAKTVVIIAHRLSTVRHCDRLLLVDGGRVADQGSFDDLAGRNASFQKLVAALSMDDHTGPSRPPEARTAEFS